MIEEIIKTNPYIISDLHLGHFRIAVYANRPSGWQDLIIDNWNKTVGKEDTVLNLGDFSLASKDDTEYFASLLNGTHYLLLGNHDKRGVGFFQKIGIIPIKERFLVYKNIIFSHRPMDVPTGFYNIRGHTHNLIPSTESDINCCVEMFNYTPKRFSEILTEFKINLLENLPTPKFL